METSRDKILYLSKADIEKLEISIPEILSCLEKAFTEKGSGRVEMPPKQAIHTNGDAFLHAMPAFVPAMNSAGMKWVGGYPNNYKQGLPYISGLLILNDIKTGIPTCVMDCTWITAIRTAVATALTARYLAVPNSKSLAILGCGVQGRYNLETINTVFKLSRVAIYDISKENATHYQTEMSSKLNLDIEVAAEPQSAIKCADIIVTAGPFFMNPSPVIKYDWIKKGAFICPLDLDSYLKPEVFLKSDFLCTDDLAQFIHFKKSGLFHMLPENLADLGDVICGKITGRKKLSDIVTSINIGIALEDMTVAPIVYFKAREAKIGTWLEI